MKRYYFLLVTVCTIMLTGCGHEHTYADATCTVQRTCIECGETEGEALGHNFIDATCEQPKICDRCGEINGEALGHDLISATCEQPAICKKCGQIEGNALGHTTEVGLCDNCKEYQGKDIIDEISNKLTSADAMSDLALTIQTSGSDVYKSFLSGLSYYEDAKEDYEAAFDLCKDYDSLSDLKEDIQDVINALPLNLAGSDLESLNLYTDDLKIFFSAQAKCQITMVLVKDKMNK